MMYTISGIPHKVGGLAHEMPLLGCFLVLAHFGDDFGVVG